MHEESSTEGTLYITLIRLVEATPEDQVVEINADQIKTPYPAQVQGILKEYSDVFAKDLLSRLPPKCDLDHRIELILGAEPPHRAPYWMSP